MFSLNLFSPFLIIREKAKAPPKLDNLYITQEK